MPPLVQPVTCPTNIVLSWAQYYVAGSPKGLSLPLFWLLCDLAAVIVINTVLHLDRRKNTLLIIRVLMCIIIWLKRQHPPH